MYMAGRFRTASRPSRTLILSAEYSATSAAVPCPLLPAGTSGSCGGASFFVDSFRSRCSMWRRGGACSARKSHLDSVGRASSAPTGSNAHRHDDVGVFAAIATHRRHDCLAHLVLQVERNSVGRYRREKI